MNCTHRKPDVWVYEDVEIGLMGETESQLVNVGAQSTWQDLGVGRFRCTLCGEVGYYTGLWRDYYERGIPCSFSDGVPRDLPPFIRSTT